MNKENSLMLKEKKEMKTNNKKLIKNNTDNNLNIKENKKLDLNLSYYYRLAQKKNKYKKDFCSIKNNFNNSSIGKEKNRDSILYKKFLEFKNSNKFQNKSNSKSYKTDDDFFSSKLTLSYSETNLRISKNKRIKNKKKNCNNQSKKNKNLEILNKNYIKKKSAHLINKNEFFNNIINNINEKNEENKKCNKNFRRNKSCINFNNKKLEADFEISEKENKTKNKKENEILKKSVKKKYNMTLNLISKNYFEKMKFNKYKYYNEKNMDYAKERRQRVEDKLNEILYEKYKISRPLRMAKRKFHIDDEAKKDKNNKKNYDNNMCKVLNIKNNIINNFNFYFGINTFKENNKDNQNEDNNENSSQVMHYNSQINNIIKMRKDLSIEDFFGDFRRDYNLLDFNFTFLFNQNKKK